MQLKSSTRGLTCQRSARTPKAGAQIGLLRCRVDSSLAMGEGSIMPLHGNDHLAATNLPRVSGSTGRAPRLGREAREDAAQPGAWVPGRLRYASRDTLDRLQST